MARVFVVGTKAEQAIVLKAVLFRPNEGDVEERHVCVGELKAKQLDNERIIEVGLRAVVLWRE